MVKGFLIPPDDRNRGGKYNLVQEKYIAVKLYWLDFLIVVFFNYFWKSSIFSLIVFHRWVSLLEFLHPALDVGKNICFDNEWQWFHNELVYTGQVIDNQRFGKVIKKANQYPQIWHVNLETLSFC